MKHPEAALQRAIAQYLTWALPEPWWFTSIAHGAGKGYVMGAMLQATGMKKGVFDILILGPDRFIAWCELKAPAGRMSPEQMAFGQMVSAFGHRMGTVRSLDDMRDLLHRWNVPLRETKPSAERIRQGMTEPQNTGRGLGGDWPESDQVGRRKRRSR